MILFTRCPFGNIYETKHEGKGLNISLFCCSFWRIQTLNTCYKGLVNQSRDNITGSMWTTQTHHFVHFRSCFFGYGLLIPIPRNRNATTYNILDNSVLPTLLIPFVESLQSLNTTTKPGPRRDGFDVEVLDWPAQSPDFNTFGMNWNTDVITQHQCWTSPKPETRVEAVIGAD